jgi:hypothetical protein
MHIRMTLSKLMMCQRASLVSDEFHLANLHAQPSVEQQPLDAGPSRERTQSQDVTCSMRA